MQTVPPFFWNERSVLVSHRGSLILEGCWSSVVAAFVSNVECQALGTSALQRISTRDRLRLRQMRHAIFFAVARHAEIQIRIGQLRGAADRAAMQRLIRV